MTRLVFLLTLSASMYAAVAAEPVAMVTDLKGTVSIFEQGGQKRLNVLAYLEPGARLRLETGASLVLTYFSKPIELTLVGPAQAQVESAGLKIVQGAKPQIRTLAAGRSGVAKKFEPVQTQRLAMATFHMRRAEPGIELVGPADAAVSVPTPEFAWNAISVTPPYRFVLSDRSGKVLLDKQIDGSTFLLPGKNALRYGQTYKWQVDSDASRGPAASAGASFSVAEAALARRINGARPKPGARFSERLLFAAQLETEGFAYESRQAWRELAKERPDDPTLRKWAQRP